MPTDATRHADRLDHLSQLAKQGNLRVAVAESLTSGAIGSALGGAPGASEWFAGSLVAYQEQVKFDVLGVPEGPVVNPGCAEAMATGARKLLNADIAISATGVGGPDASEGHPPGTVFMSVATASGTTTRRLDLDGDPEEVISGTVDEALGFLTETVAAVAAT